jgi:hypothetical protein
MDLFPFPVRTELCNARLMAYFLYFLAPPTSEPLRSRHSGTPLLSRYCLRFHCLLAEAQPMAAAAWRSELEHFAA